MGQNMFTFMVNGQFWQKREVSDNIINRGEIVISVATPYAKMKNVVFRLVKSAQKEGDYIASWFPCFWLVDKDLILKDGELHLRV